MTEYTIHHKDEIFEQEYFNDRLCEILSHSHNGLLFGRPSCSFRKPGLNSFRYSGEVENMATGEEMELTNYWWRGAVVQVWSSGDFEETERFFFLIYQENPEGP